MNDNDVIAWQAKNTFAMQNEVRDLKQWTITYTNLDGAVEQGPLYEKQATAELAATWRSKKRNQNWIAVEFFQDEAE